MKQGRFCFLSEQYFKDFPDENLMKNKEIVNGSGHRRPCFFAFPDDSKPIYWLVPISSKYEKYRGIYDKKVQKYGFCNTLFFGNVAGVQAAFLIQNMCPVTSDYIIDFYVDKASQKYVAIDKRLEESIIKNAKSVLEKQRKGIPLIFPDVLKIEATLIQQIEKAKNIENVPSSEPKLEKEHAIYNHILMDQMNGQSSQKTKPKEMNTDPER